MPRPAEPDRSATARLARFADHMAGYGAYRGLDAGIGEEPGGWESTQPLANRPSGPAG